MSHLKNRLSWRKIPEKYVFLIYWFTILLQPQKNYLHNSHDPNAKSTRASQLSRLYHDIQFFPLLTIIVEKKTVHPDWSHWKFHLKSSSTVSDFSENIHQCLIQIFYSSQNRRQTRENRQINRRIFTLNRSDSQRAETWQASG